MHIPTGSWVVVSRKCNDTRSKGNIVTGLISRKAAMMKAALYNSNSPDVNYWAMPRIKYDTPYAGE